MVLLVPSWFIVGGTLREVFAFPGLDKPPSLLFVGLTHRLELWATCQLVPEGREPGAEGTVVEGLDGPRNGTRSTTCGAVLDRSQSELQTPVWFRCGCGL
jgi:hypothetical protein